MKRVAYVLAVSVCAAGLLSACSDPSTTNYGGTGGTGPAAATLYPPTANMVPVQPEPSCGAASLPTQRCMPNHPGH